MRSHLRSLCLVFAFLVIAAVPAHAGGPSSAGVAVGFARVNLDDGTVTSFGGKGTKEVTTGPTSTGVILFFVGKYPKDLTRELVVAHATAEGDEDNQYAVANAIVANATRDQISVVVNAWKSSTLAPATGYAFVILYSAVAPEE